MPRRTYVLPHLLNNKSNLHYFYKYLSPADVADIIHSYSLDIKYVQQILDSWAEYSLKCAGKTNAFYTELFRQLDHLTNHGLTDAQLLLYS